MALLQDLIQQIDDVALRERILKEANKLAKQKKFGLVFEEHLPECTPLYDVPIRVGSNVAMKTGPVNDIYIVLKIKGTEAVCERRESHEQSTISLNELVVVAQFGEPIYPTLTPIDAVENAPDSDLWHTLIEADNYHALQMLEYLYAGKVDCIYIDPPYNTGAKDWKYNNNYVDGSDSYRHSKWLSMMEKRLKLAKKMLNPDDSVLIVTIDEKEYLHLGCLLEELFPEARIQMVSITISPSGAKRDNLFSRSDEYIYIVLFGKAHVVHPSGDGNEKEIRWFYLRRTDYASRRGTKKGGIAQFYPIYVDNKTKQIVCIGDYLTPEQSVLEVPKIKGATAVFPIREDGVEMNWGVTKDTLLDLKDKGFVQVTEGYELQPYIFKYVSTKYKKNFEENRWKIVGERKDSSKIIVETSGKITRATTVWQSKVYDAGAYGTSLLKSIIGDGKFSFPKSIYSVIDTLRYFVQEKQNALILDFFAGSGTTMHAVNILNAIDNGNRRCICVTNNEVSDTEAKVLAKQGLHPGENEWDKYGIARYVTWPRLRCAIKGVNLKNEMLEGDYGTPAKGIDLGYELPKSNGFKTNAAFFKLSFLDKTSVALGRQFKELLPVLWMKSGAAGKCPELISDNLPDMLILPENKMAILIDEIHYQKFDAELRNHQEVKTVFIVTDSESAYKEMVRTYDGKECYQLYRDYLDNFRINTGR